MLDDDVRELLGEVGHMADGIGDDEAVSRASHEHDVVTLFDRCRSMFGAVLLLLDHEFVHEGRRSGARCSSTR